MSTRDKDGLLYPSGAHATMHIMRPGQPVPEEDSDQLGWHPLAALALRVSNDAAAIGARRELAAEMGRCAIKVHPERWAEILRRSAPPVYVAAVFRAPVPDPNLIISTYPDITGNFKRATGVLAVSISDAVLTMHKRAVEHGIDHLAAFFRG